MHHLVTLKIFYLIHFIGVSTLPAQLQASIPLSGSFLPRLGVAERGRRWQRRQVPESSFEFMLQTFQIGFLLENSHLQALVYPPPTFPISFLCLLMLQCCILCACVRI